MASLTRLIVDRVLDADLAALLWLLAEHGVPLVAVAPDPASAERVRSAVAALLAAESMTGDGSIAGGVVHGRSLDDVLGLSGGGPVGTVPDDARDLGVVAVIRDGRVAAVHYVRPVERDGAGHLQRRPPALLADWNEGAAVHDHFWWGITDELALRCSMTRADFEIAHSSRSRLLADLAAAGVRDPGDLRQRIATAGLSAVERPDSVDTPN